MSSLPIRNKFMAMPVALLATIICLASSIHAQSQTGSYGFAAEQKDTATGLINLRARYYDPETGTFLSKDPLGVASTLNAYQYCKNDPVDLTDPMGLFNSSLFWHSLGGVALNGAAFSVALSADATGWGALVAGAATVNFGYQGSTSLVNLLKSLSASPDDAQAALQAIPVGPAQLITEYSMLANPATVPGSPAWNQGVLYSSGADAVGSIALGGPLVGARGFTQIGFDFDTLEYTETALSPQTFASFASTTDTLFKWAGVGSGVLTLQDIATDPANSATLQSDLNSIFTSSLL